MISEYSGRTLYSERTDLNISKKTMMRILLCDVLRWEKEPSMA